MLLGTRTLSVTCHARVRRVDAARASPEFCAPPERAIGLLWRVRTTTSAAQTGKVADLNTGSAHPEAPLMATKKRAQETKTA